MTDSSWYDEETALPDRGGVRLADGTVLVYRRLPNYDNWLPEWPQSPPPPHPALRATAALGFRTVIARPDPDPRPAEKAALLQLTRGRGAQGLAWTQTRRVDPVGFETALRQLQDAGWPLAVHPVALRARRQALRRNRAAAVAAIALVAYPGEDVAIGDPEFTEGHFALLATLLEGDLRLFPLLQSEAERVMTAAGEMALRRGVHGAARLAAEYVASQTPHPLNGRRVLEWLQAEPERWTAGRWQCRAARLFVSELRRRRLVSPAPPLSGTPAEAEQTLVDAMLWTVAQQSPPLLLVAHLEPRTAALVRLLAVEAAAEVRVRAAANIKRTAAAVVAYLLQIRVALAEQFPAGDVTAVAGRVGRDSGRFAAEVADLLVPRRLSLQTLRPAAGAGAWQFVDVHDMLRRMVEYHGWTKVQQRPTDFAGAVYEALASVVRLQPADLLRMAMDGADAVLATAAERGGGEAARGEISPEVLQATVLQFMGGDAAAGLALSGLPWVMQLLPRESEGAALPLLEGGTGAGVGPGAGNMKEHTLQVDGDDAGRRVVAPKLRLQLQNVGAGAGAGAGGSLKAWAVWLWAPARDPEHRRFCVRIDEVVVDPNGGVEVDEIDIPAREGAEGDYFAVAGTRDLGWTFGPATRVRIQRLCVRTGVWYEEINNQPAAAQWTLERGGGAGDYDRTLHLRGFRAPLLLPYADESEAETSVSRPGELQGALQHACEVWSGARKIEGGWRAEVVAPAPRRRPFRDDLARGLRKALGGSSLEAEFAAAKRTVIADPRPYYRGWGVASAVGGPATDPGELYRVLLSVVVKGGNFDQKRYEVGQEYVKNLSPDAFAREWQFAQRVWSGRPDAFLAMQAGVAGKTLYDNLIKDTNPILFATAEDLLRRRYAADVTKARDGELQRRRAAEARAGRPENMRLSTLRDLSAVATRVGEMLAAGASVEDVKPAIAKMLNWVQRTFSAPGWHLDPGDLPASDAFNAMQSLEDACGSVVTGENRGAITGLSNVYNTAHGSLSNAVPVIGWDMPLPVTTFEETVKMISRGMDKFVKESVEKYGDLTFVTTAKLVRKVGTFARIITLAMLSYTGQPTPLDNVYYEIVNGNFNQFGDFFYVIVPGRRDTLPQLKETKPYHRMVYSLLANMLPIVLAYTIRLLQLAQDVEEKLQLLWAMRVVVRTASRLRRAFVTAVNSEPKLEIRKIAIKLVQQSLENLTVAASLLPLGHGIDTIAAAQYNHMLTAEAL